MTVRLHKLVEQIVPRVYLSPRERRALVASRHLANIRGKTLAARLGVSLGTLNKYESGERNPPADLLTTWRAVLAAELRRAA